MSTANSVGGTGAGGANSPGTTAASTEGSIFDVVRRKWGKVQDVIQGIAAPLKRRSMYDELPEHVWPSEQIEMSHLQQRGLGLGHNFAPCQLSNPTWCDYCGDFIWGLYKQCLRCQICQYTCHQHCVPAVNLNCKSISDDGIDVTRVSAVRTPSPSEPRSSLETSLSLGNLQVRPGCARNVTSSTVADGNGGITTATTTTTASASVSSRFAEYVPNSSLPPEARASSVEGQSSTISSPSPGGGFRQSGTAAGGHSPSRSRSASEGQVLLPSSLPGGARPVLVSEQASLNGAAAKSGFSSVPESSPLHGQHISPIVDPHSSSGRPDAAIHSQLESSSSSSSQSPPPSGSQAFSAPHSSSQSAVADGQPSLAVSGSGDGLVTAEGHTLEGEAVKELIASEKDETDSGYRSGTIPDEKLPKVPSQATLDRQELKRKIAKFNHFVPAASLEATGKESFQGFLKVTMNLIRPITMELGARPPSIYELLTREHIIEENTQQVAFYMPRDTHKSLHITSDTTTKELVTSLLKKFHILDHPRKFAMYEQEFSDKNKLVRLRRLTDKDFPLRAILTWDPERIRNYRMVLQENETGEIVWDAFSLPELGNFLKVLDREEKETILELRHKYAYMRQIMEKRLVELRNSRKNQAKNKA